MFPFSFTTLLVPTPKEQKEAFLLYRIKVHKDKGAFTELHNIHAPSIRRFLRAKLPSAEDVDDVLSITFIRAWNYLLHTKIESAPGILFTIARSGIADFYRSRRTGDVSLDVDGQAEQIATDHGASARRTETRTEILLVREVLKEFSEEEQLAFTLRHFEGLSVRDVAVRLEKTENATNVMLHRLKKKMQQKFT